MAEDMAELGLEGLNHVTEHYHDFIYDHLPAFPHHRHKPAQQALGHSHPQPAAARVHSQERDKDQAAPLPPPPPLPQQPAMTDYDPRSRRRDASPSRDGPSWERSYYGRPMSEAGSRDDRRRFSAGPVPPQAYGYPPPPPSPVAGYLPLPPGQEVPRYIPPYNPNTPTLRERPRERARSVGSRSPSPDKKRKHKWDKRSEGAATFASSVVGALAGGLAGNELGKGDTLTTIASAMIGAVGGVTLEKQYEKKHHKKEQSKHAKDRDRRRSRDRSRDRSMDRSRDRSRDRRGTRYIEVEEEYGYIPNSYDRDWRGRDGWEVDRRRRRSR